MSTYNFSKQQQIHLKNVIKIIDEDQQRRSILRPLDDGYLNNNLLQEVDKLKQHPLEKPKDGQVDIHKLDRELIKNIFESDSPVSSQSPITNCVNILEAIKNKALCDKGISATMYHALNITIRQLDRDQPTPQQLESIKSIKNWFQKSSGILRSETRASKLQSKGYDIDKLLSSLDQKIEKMEKVKDVSSLKQQTSPEAANSTSQFRKSSSDIRNQSSVSSESPESSESSESSEKNDNSPKPK
jgi:hypothetical protein